MLELRQFSFTMPPPEKLLLLTRPVESLLRAGEQTELRRLKKIKDKVKKEWTTYTDLTDAELQKKTTTLRKKLQEPGARFEDIKIEAFATVCEAAKRVLHLTSHDVQIMGGLALSEGKIAEMDTGEGKTLVAAMAAYLNALDVDHTQKGNVHVVTANDYLAQRDAEWLQPLYEFLGLSVGVTLPGMNREAKQAAYAHDITYGTANEFGFDYLRDNRVDSPDKKVQRGQKYAIIDEVDSILIDDARVPLIITGGPILPEPRWQYEFARLVQNMKPGDDETGDYKLDKSTGEITPTDRGIARIEDQLGIVATDKIHLYTIEHTDLVGYLQRALRAKEFATRDKDYIIEKNGQVIAIDQHTGRRLPERRYEGGLHQALEAKEGVKINPDYEINGTISLQNYFHLYENLSGMTGTAKRNEQEFNKTYGLEVVRIPPHRPRKREDHPDVIYRTEEEKLQAIVEDIIEKKRKGQPVLVGTVNIAKSEALSKLLTAHGIEHNLLNAKNDAEEAQIIAQAGKLGTVTIATNMAGRGTDIKLGGEPEDFIQEYIRQRKTEDPNARELTAEEKDVLRAWHERVIKQQVINAGGLYVIGTERHASRRIDDQLIGRAGRQGDPGESRFYLSLDDTILDIYAREKVEAVKTALAHHPPMTPIEDERMSKFLAGAQQKTENQQAEERKNVLKYDEALIEQRKIIYRERQNILENDGLEEHVYRFIDDVVKEYVSEITAVAPYPEDWNLDKLLEIVGEMLPVTITIDELLAKTGGNREQLTAEYLTDEISNNIMDTYDEQRLQNIRQFGETAANTLEKNALLDALDRNWKEHLYELSYLRSGIQLRAYAQKDPLVEYKRDAFNIFTDTFARYKRDALAKLFNKDMDQQKEEPTLQAST